MANQATLKGDKQGQGGSQSNGSPEARVVGGIAEFGNDITTLAELQARLAMLDLKEAVAKALVPTALVVVGMTCLLGAIPVVILGVADLVSAAFRISDGAARILTGVVVLIVSALLVVVFGRRIGPSFSGFQRSQEELTRNLSWIRTVLLYSGRHMPRRVR